MDFVYLDRQSGHVLVIAARLCIPFVLSSFSPAKPRLACSILGPEVDRRVNEPPLRSPAV